MQSISSIENLPILDASYKGNDIEKEACKILNMQNVHGWSVVDSEGDLALAHYRDDADKRKYGHIRGLLLDLEVGAVLAGSFGHTPTGVASGIMRNGNELKIFDKEGVPHVFDADQAIIKRVFEGVVIRVVWHKSKLYRITHRKINPVRSRWGQSKTFLEMYEEAGGPTAEQLFDTTKPYSSTCYDFLVVDPSLLVGTRQRIIKPYIVFLTQRTIETKRPSEEVAEGKATFVSTDKINGSVDEPMIHNPKSLCLAEANHHLMFGYYNEYNTEDMRQLTGEAVIIYQMKGGSIVDIIKVHSIAYDWRCQMRNDNPNIVNQFYLHLKSVYSDLNSEGDWNNLRNRYVMIPHYNEESVTNLCRKTGGILIMPTGKVNRSDLNTKDSRLHLLWLNYLVSLPPHAQEGALKILVNFKRDREDVICWIQSLEEKHKDVENAELHTRIKSIITASRQLAARRANNTGCRVRNPNKALPSLVKNTIRNLLNKEEGSKLYALVREMKRALNPPEVKEEESLIIEPVVELLSGLAI